MKFISQKIAGVYCIKPEPFVDNRGLFRRHFCQREFAQHGLPVDVRQSNISENTLRHTLRGFHFQKPPHLEAKLLSVIRGSLHDIVVDLRPDSPTYLRWIAVQLSEENRLSLYVPPGCANAWLTLADSTWILYFHSEFYTPGSEGGIRYNDPLFQFQWPVPPAVISPKDAGYPAFVPEASPAGSSPAGRL
jgi:dTDP-4-dehydrorhamnose 3,5-epimerase